MDREALPSEGISGARALATAIVKSLVSHQNDISRKQRKIVIAKEVRILTGKKGS
jgi:hypothetical protein